VCFDFLCNFVWCISHYKKDLREMWWKMCTGLNVYCPLFLPDFNETWIFSTDYVKILKRFTTKHSFLLCKDLTFLCLSLNTTNYHADTFVWSNQCELRRNFIVTLLLIRRTACARAQFSGCSSTTNAYSETGRMAVCFYKLTLGALCSRSALSLLVGALFKKFSLF
jgi:hypothetical protein